MVQIKAYGKINLTLEVLGLRLDGYHEIRSIMQNIELHDILSFNLAENGTLSLNGNCKSLKYDESNLIYRAAKALQEYSGTLKGVKIYIDKKIPLEAGLAGGSADAAATLIGLNKLWKLELTIKELIDIGTLIGSDIPFCLIGKTALVEGRGEIVRQIISPPKESLLIVKPNFGASTKLIYNKYDEIICQENLNFTELMIDKITNQGEYKNYLYNDLQSVTTKIYPEVQEILDIMKKESEFVLMSGSGPTCFAFGKANSIKFLYNEFKGKYKEVIVTSLMT